MSRYYKQQRHVSAKLLEVRATCGFSKFQASAALLPPTRPTVPCLSLTCFPTETEIDTPSDQLVSFHNHFDEELL
jgi:hypothetical protein